MKEVRICWQPTVVHDEDYDERIQPCGGWRTLSRDLLKQMRDLCDAANRVYGAHSHWLETRSITHGSEQRSR